MQHGLRTTGIRHKHHNISILGLPLFAVASCAAAQAPPEPSRIPTPDLGPNVLIFSPTTSSSTMQQKIDAIYAVQQHNEFGSERNALLFLPGEYHVDVPVGFYTQVIGLGVSPDAVHIVGNVHADASLPRNNATCTFWRAAEGFSVTPSGGATQWAASQAGALCPLPLPRHPVLPPRS